MSHLAEVECEIRDMVAVKTACQRLGWELKENAGEFQAWYDRQKADHAIVIPGCRLEIGLVRQQNGSFKPVYDDMARAGNVYLNKENGLCGFLPEYEAEVGRSWFRRKGIRFTESREKDGRIVLRGAM